MKLIDLERAIEYAKDKDYIKTTSQENAVREVFELATVEAVPIEAINKIRAEIEQNAYPIVHGVNNHEKGMTLYGIMQIIDKYRANEE